MSPQNNPSALAALNGARPVLAHFDQPRSAEDLAADIIDLWAGAEGALQALVGNPSLTGQQLIRAARQAELITLDQAHAELEFLAARDRANRTSYKPTQADGDAAVDGFRALEAALTGSSTGAGAAAASASTSSAPSAPAYTPRSRPAQPPPASRFPPPPSRPAQPPSPYAPPSAGGGYRQPPAYASRAAAGPPTIEMPGAFTADDATGNTPAGGGIGRTNVQHALAAAESKSRFPRLSMPVWIAIAVVILLGVGGYFLFARNSSGDSLNAGIDALKNGQNERARGEFAKAVKDDPNSPTPHVFLARIARTEGDLATARAQLDTALRLDSKNAIALREMGLVLFSSAQYDLARRFFVRAVTANPEDRASQGYLGCALMRLGRVPEGTKFIRGAGTGAWQACLQPVTPATTAPPPL
jgi:tetratricopeptide (TPR) repeat protein